MRGVPCRPKSEQSTRLRERVMKFPGIQYAVLCIIAVLLVTTTGVEARYAAIVHQAQTRLAAAGHDPGVLDGAMGRNTARAITAYQTEKGLEQTGTLDSATLQSLAIGTDPGLAVADWRTVPDKAEIDALSKPINDPENPFADYRRHAPAAGLDLPGLAILSAMNQSADLFGSRGPEHPRHSKQGLKLLRGCLKTTHFPDHWSDITVHYYCQMSLPRRCYTNALAGKSTRGVKLARTRAYSGCAKGRLADSEPFKWVTKSQPEIFQYLMFAQTHAFKHDQEQSIINAFYGVEDPANRSECKRKRPVRTEDPHDGTHCLVDKVMRRKLVGRGR